MLKENYGILKWNGKNKAFYISKGYVYTKIGDKFKVEIKDLTKNSKAKVIVICDYCGTEIERTYQEYLKHHHLNYGDACKKCQSKKAKLVVQEKYGVDNVSQVEEFKKKSQKTCIEHYGVDNASKASDVIEKIKKTNLNKYGVESTAILPEVIQKRKDTCLQKYGVENVFSLEEIKQKICSTNLKRYGVKYPTQNLEIQEKVKETNRKRFEKDYYTQTEEYKIRLEKTCYEKYGVSHMLKAPEVREKIANTLSKNGNCPTSSQQLQLRNILEELYGKCELNVPCGTSLLDCVVEVKGVKIDVEYDGYYWHQDKQKDRRRDEFTKSQGYKIFRILSDRKLPSKEEISEKISILVETNKEFIKIEMV